MPVPVIDPESSVLSYPQWVTWEHQFSATNTPYDWNITAGNFPSGMSFQPSIKPTGATSGNLFTFNGHGLPNGAAVVFRSKTGGSGFTTNTIYFVVNTATSTFQLAAAPGDVAIAMGTTMSASLLYRPGYVSGAGTIAGISTVRLNAVNGTGPAVLDVIFTIGIESAAASPDGNADIVWNLATNDIIAQTSSALNLTPVDRNIPILSVKEQDDLITRLRLAKSTSFIDLGPLPTDTSLKLVLKELEPENQVVVSDVAIYVGSGDSANYLVHAKFDGDALAASLENYEDDQGTFYDALAEFELTFTNPYGGFGPGTLKRTSKTFKIRIERDLGET